MPITALSNKFVSSVENRHKYQGNEYLEANELRWMDFQARQYDPQLGRFLGIDPLAGAGGQQVLSPYHAMGCNPVTLIDPLGLKSFNAGDKLFDYGVPSAGVAYIEGESFVLGGSWLESFEKQLERANERAAMLAEEAHLRAITGVYQALLEFLSVYGSETLLSGGTLVFSTDPKNGVIDVLVIAKGNDQLGGEEQANGGEESNKGQQQNGGDDRWLATDITGAVSKGLMIPDAAFNFAKTKTGKLLSMGGAHAYQSMPRAQQIAAVRELQLAGKLAKPLTRGIAVVNFAATATAVTDDLYHGRYKSAGARTAVWGIAAGATFIPVAGWGIAIGIGIADAIWGDDFYKYVEKNW